MKATEVLTTIIDGIPTNLNADVIVTSNDEEILIHEVRLKLLKKDILNTYRIKLENVLDVIVATKKEIVAKNKSVVGRGVAGAVLFGPVGAMLGGMSGLGKKEKSVKKGPFLVISYKSKEGEIKNITFNAESSLVSLTAKSFALEVKKKLNKINKNKNHIVNDIEL